MEEKDIETLNERIQELEATLESRDNDIKTLNDRISELEGNIETKNNEFNALTDERDKLKRDFDTLKQNSSVSEIKTETEETEENLDMGDLLRQIKNIMF